MNPWNGDISEGSTTQFLPALIAASRLPKRKKQNWNTEFEMSQMFPALMSTGSVQDLWAVLKKIIFKNVTEI
jgi:hypothetical protein